MYVSNGSTTLTVQKGPHPGTIAGVVIGSIVFIALLAIAIVRFKRNKADKKKACQTKLSPYTTTHTHNTIAPMTVPDKEQKNVDSNTTSQYNNKATMSSFSFSTYTSIFPILSRSQGQSNRASFRPISMSLFSRQSFSRMFEDVLNDPLFRTSLQRSTRTFSKTFSKLAIEGPTPPDASTLEKNAVYNEIDAVKVQIEPLPCATDTEATSTDTPEQKTTTTSVDPTKEAHQMIVQPEKILVNARYQKSNEINTILDTVRNSTTETLGEKSVASLQFIGFSQAMDSNYQKKHMLSVKNDIAVY